LVDGLDAATLQSPARMDLSSVAFHGFVAALTAALLMTALP
jgi:hypothetical protein